jgi:putative FmdB family regulatory protein
MPIYEFHCNECSAEFEELVDSRPESISAVVCPKCKSRDIKRKLSMFSSGSSDDYSRAPNCAPGGG